MNEMLRFEGRYIQSGNGPQTQLLHLPLEQTALLLIDLYYDDQVQRRWGQTDDPFTQQLLDMEEAIAAALAAARQAKLPILYPTNSAPRIGMQRSAFGRHFRRTWGSDMTQSFAEGGIDGREFEQGERDTMLQFSPRLAPCPGDLYIRKHAYSGFYATRLDTALRNMEIRYLVCAGLWANVCMAATALDALYRNYDVVWLRDGTLAGDGDTSHWLTWFEEIVGFTVLSADFAASCHAVADRAEQ